MEPVRQEESRKLDLVGHLEELRRRILYCLAALTAIAVFLFMRCGPLMAFVTRPVRGTAEQLIYISPTEAFTAHIKVAFLGSLVLTFPLILYQLWAFLAPAFQKRIRRRLVVWLSLSLSLFFAGVSFSYFVALPAALSFLLSFGRDAAVPMITLGRYISFFGALELAGGVVFQIPVVLGLLSDLGLVRSSDLKKKRPHAIVAIMVFAAVITPTQDIVNMLIFALPMLALFEVGVFLVGRLERRKSRV